MESDEEARSSGSEDSSEGNSDFDMDPDGDSDDEDCSESDNETGDGGAADGARSDSGGGRKRRRRGNLGDGGVANDWRDVTGKNECPPQIAFVFTGQRFSEEVRKCEKELDFFQLFFSDKLLEEIGNETNRYVTAKIETLGELTPRSTWQDWKDVTLEEMKPFLGMLINM